MSAAVTEDAPMQHVRTPPGAKNFPRPTPESLGPFADALRSMQGTFWTADVISILKMRDVPGYRGNGGNSRAQGMLDFLGYRVVEVRKNRGGYAYRWVKDPNAVVGEAQTRSERLKEAAATKLSVVPGERKAKRGKVWVEPEPKVELTPDQQVEEVAAVAADVAFEAGRPEDQAERNIEARKQAREDRRQAAAIAAETARAADEAKAATLARRAAPQPAPEPVPAEPEVHVEPTGREFIDTADSWTAGDLPDTMTLGDVRAMLGALGLGWEIRVWRA